MSLLLDNRFEGLSLGRFILLWDLSGHISICLFLGDYWSYMQMMLSYRVTNPPHSFRRLCPDVRIPLNMTTAEPLTEEQEVFLKHIQKKGLKRTSQRALILDVFLRTEEHLSNEDLYQLVKKEDPTVGQTTVYRTLKLLAEAGLAREVRFGDGRAHYEH